MVAALADAIELMMRRTYIPAILVGLMVTVLIVTSDEPTSALNVSRPLHHQLPPAPQGDFVFVQRLTCRAQGGETLRHLVARLAAHVQSHEPLTLGYELLQSDRSANEFLLLERYSSREAMLRPHKTSSAFAEFKRALAAADIIVEKQGSSWLSSGVGFSGSPSVAERSRQRNSSQSRRWRRRRVL